MTCEREEPEKKGTSHRGKLYRLLPEDFWKHHRAARRERLLSWRSFLDAAIERLEEKPAKAERRTWPKLIPEAFWEHRRAAWREDLLAGRSLLDAVAERLEERPTAKAQQVEAE